MPVIKSMSRSTKSYGQVIQYLFKRDPSYTPIATQNLRGTDRYQWHHEFNINEENRKHKRCNSIKGYHEILSFSQSSTDYLDDTTLHLLAKEYLERRAPNCLGIASIHRDTENVHIHFLVSGTQYESGLSARISKSAFREFKQEFEQYQQEQFPELEESLVHHSKQLEQFREQKAAVSFPIQALHHTPEELHDTVQDLFAQALSKEHFLALLEANGLEWYQDETTNQYGIVSNAEKHLITDLDFNATEAFVQLDEVEQTLKDLANLRNAQEPNRNHHLEQFEQLVQDISYEYLPEEGAIDTPAFDDPDLPTIELD